MIRYSVFPGNRGAQTQGNVVLWQQECHSSTPNHSLSHLPHDPPGAEGDSRKGTQKTETLLPNLLPTSVMIPITDAKCHWPHDILGATKWIVMLATFISLGPALWRLKSSQYTGSKNMRRTAGTHKKRSVTPRQNTWLQWLSYSQVQNCELNEDMVYLSFCNVNGTLSVFSNNLRNKDGKH